MHRDPSRFEPLLWDDVRLFLALCRARTVREAGHALRVDPSTASRRLAALEEALETTLFVRTRDGITPTEAAEALLPEAEAVERDVARFASAADGLEREVAGLVRVTCPPDVAECVVAPALAELAARHPRLRFALEPGEAVLDLARREADVALRIVRPTGGDLVMTRALAVRWVLAANADLAARVGRLKRWDDVPWVGCGEGRAGFPTERWRARHAKGVEPVLRSDDLLAQITAVRVGLGAALLPLPTVLYLGLVPIPLAPVRRREAADWPENELYLVTHRALRDVPRVRVVWDALLARLRALPA